MALLATFKAMNNYSSENDRFAIAFPDTIGHEKVLSNVKAVLDKPAVTIYLVSDKDVIEFIYFKALKYRKIILLKRLFLT